MPEKFEGKSTGALCGGKIQMTRGNNNTEIYQDIQTPAKPVLVKNHDKRVPDSKDRQVGHNIRAYRKAQGITQADLGAILGVSFQQIQKYEKGANKVGAGRLHTISQFFNLPIEQLFAGLNEKKELTNPIYEESLSAKAQELLLLIQKTHSIKNRKQLINFLQFFVSLAVPS
ncbi:MAG: helix-turn-helix transcriptional regulator [Kordiimonadaceae bacterium]|nr:helix-turn-helix transcriptional regulator [Kordiimonadaceae bacterium]